jgi:dephospho-CoA kinase
MLKVGITGGIGAGKSTVCKIFAALNIPILDSDALAKQIIATNAQVHKQLIEAFGDDIFLHGELQKQILASKAFANEQSTATLNAIIHPLVQQETEHWFAQQETQYAIKEAAVMIESGSHKKLDLLIGVTTPEHTRIERVLQRNPNLSIAEIQQRIAKQMPENEKAKFYDYNIINDGKQLVLPQVLHIHNLILHKCHEKEKH